MMEHPVEAGRRPAQGNVLGGSEGAHMAFRDFSFPQVEQDLGLHLLDADLFSSVPPYPVREVILEVVQEGVQLALANSTEKAKSEFIIAPVLLDLRRLAGGKIALFSGLEWEVD